MKDNRQVGKNIMVTEMPQGCYIQQTLTSNRDRHVLVSSVEDAKMLIQSLNRMIESMYRFETCPECGGQGWFSESVHGCNGDDAVCAYLCPVEGQRECERCYGDGMIVINKSGKEFPCVEDAENE